MRKSRNVEKIDPATTPQIRCVNCEGYGTEYEHADERDQIEVPCSMCGGLGFVPIAFGDNEDEEDVKETDYDPRDVLTKGMLGTEIPGLGYRHLINKRREKAPREQREAEDARREAGARDDGGSSVLVDIMDDLAMLDFPPEGYAREIVIDLQREWRNHFLAKARKYRAVPDLGAKGIVPELNRKHFLIRDRIWDDAPVVGEPTDEVILDAIGNLFMILWLLRRDA